MTAKPISYSEARVWYRNRQEHYKTYVLGERQEPTPAMVFGSYVHRVMEHPHVPFPKEMRVLAGYWREQGREDIAARFDRRHEFIVANIRSQMASRLMPEREWRRLVPLESGERLVIVLDGLDMPGRRMADYKTYTSTESEGNYEVWNNTVVGTHKQFSVYAFGWERLYHSYFREIEIDAIDVAVWPKGSRKRNRVNVLLTNRDFGSCRWAEEWIETAIQQMKEVGVWTKRIDRKHPNIADQLSFELSTSQLAKSVL
jgi:hypothetical protein